MGLQIFNMQTKCVDTWNRTIWFSACALVASPPPPSVPNCVEINGVCWAMSNVDMSGTFADNIDGIRCIFFRIFAKK